MEEQGLLRDDEHKRQIEMMRYRGDDFPLEDKEGRVLGIALKTSDEAKNPVYVSIGHRTDLETAREVVLKCSQYRIPEPIRQADIRRGQNKLGLSLNLIGQYLSGLGNTSENCDCP